MLPTERSLLPPSINISHLFGGQVVESERIEFKRGWNPLSVLHTMCAFANDFHNLGGGYILIGIEEKDGMPTHPAKGLDAIQINRIQKELLELGHESIRPNHHPTISVCQIDGVNVLILRVYGGLYRPYKARISLAKGGHDWGYFIRKGSSTVRAKGQDETELLSLAATVPFDDLINQRARVSDLSRDLIRSYLLEVHSDLASHVDDLTPVDLGRQMNIVSGPTEDILPINVGLLFFNPEPWRFFPVTQIDVVWFPEGTAGDNFTEKIFRGPLHQMTREALEYIRRNYLNKTIIKHRDRAEATHVENFPYVAIEETLINAIYHRSYQEREPVEVRIGTDELIVLSYPGPDRSVRLDQLRAGRANPRRYRNRRIGEFLKELELTEGRCTGIPKIIKVMSDNGSPPPEFEFDDDHSYFMVRLPVHPLARPPVASGLTDQVTPQVEDQVRDQVRDQVGHLVRVVDGEMSRLQLQAALGLKGLRHFREAYLVPALSAGLVEMTIPTAPNSRLQKYRLTEKGLVWRAAASESAARTDPVEVRVPHLAPKRPTH